MPTTVVSSVGTGIGRDFASIGAAVAALPNLTTSDTIQILEIYNDNAPGLAALTENPLVSVAGATATNYLVIRAAAGHEFDRMGLLGAWVTNTGGCQRVSTPFTRYAHMGFISTNSSGSAFNVVRINSPGCWFHACYAEMEGGTHADGNVGFADFSTGNTVFTDCIAKGANGAGLSIGFGAPFQGTVLLNCAARSIRRNVGVVGTGFLVGGGVPGATGTIHNCIALNSGAADFSVDVAGGSTISHCVSSDGTASGTGSVTGVPMAAVWPSSYDFRPFYASAPVNRGMDPTSLWPGGAPTDFDDVPHDQDGNGFEIGPFNLDDGILDSPAVAHHAAPDVATVLIAGISSPLVVEGIAPPVATIVQAGLASPAVHEALAPPLSALLVAGLASPLVADALAPPVALELVAGLLSAVLDHLAPPLSTVLIARLASPAVMDAIVPPLVGGVGLGPPLVIVHVLPPISTRFGQPGINVEAVVVVAIELDVVSSHEVLAAATVAPDLELEVVALSSMTISTPVSLAASGSAAVIA